MLVGLRLQIKSKDALAKLLLDVWGMPDSRHMLVRKSSLAEFGIPLGSPEFDEWQHDNAIGVAQVTSHCVWLKHQPEKEIA
jgi:hypothetical protein